MTVLVVYVHVLAHNGTLRLRERLTNRVEEEGLAILIFGENSRSRFH